MVISHFRWVLVSLELAFQSRFKITFKTFSLAISYLIDIKIGGEFQVILFLSSISSSSLNKTRLGCLKLLNLKLECCIQKFEKLRPFNPKIFYRQPRNSNLQVFCTFACLYLWTISKYKNQWGSWEIHKNDICLHF